MLSASWFRGLKMRLGIPCCHGLLLFLCRGDKGAASVGAVGGVQTARPVAPETAHRSAAAWPQRESAWARGRFWTMVVPWMEAQNVAAGGAVGETAVPMKAGPDRKPAASGQAAPGRGFRAGCEGMVPKANL